MKYGRVNASSTSRFQNEGLIVHTKRQVLIKMCKFNMFITAVCVLFLISLLRRGSLWEFFWEIFWIFGGRAESVAVFPLPRPTAKIRSLYGQTSSKESSNEERDFWSNRKENIVEIFWVLEVISYSCDAALTQPCMQSISFWSDGLL